MMKEFTLAELSKAVMSPSFLPFARASSSACVGSVPSSFRSSMSISLIRMRAARRWLAAQCLVEED